MNIIISAIFFIGFSLLPSTLYAEGNTYYVTPTGNASDPDCSGGGAPSCAGAYDADDFNGLRGDYSDDTFFFTGKFSTRLQVLFVEGTPGHPVTLDGYYVGDCDPLNSVCSSSALLQQGLEIGNNQEGPDYINVYDFRMTRTNSTNPAFRIYGDVSEGDDEKHCDYITVKRNYVYETYGTMFCYYSGRYSTVEENKFFVFGQNDTDATQGINLIEVDDLVFKNNEAGHDERNYPSGCTSAEMIELHGCHRVLIEGNNIYGAPNQSGIRPKESFGGNTDLVIRFNKVHDNRGSAYDGFVTSNGSSTTLTDSNANWETDEWNTGFYVKNFTEDGTSTKCRSDITDTTSDTITFVALPGTCSGNGAFSTGESYLITKSGETAGKGIAVRTDPASENSEVYIYANYIYNNLSRGISVGSEVRNIHGWSNIVSSTGQYGIVIATASGYTGPIDVYFYNNTIVRNGDRNETEDNRGGIVISSGTGLRFKNNILWNNRPGGKEDNYWQIYATKSISSLEHNTYYHSSTTPTINYDGGLKSIAMMQETYDMEDDYPRAGEIPDLIFKNPAGPDNTYGTADDDYRLNGTYIKNGANLSKCFDVSVQDKNYHMCYSDALDPSETNWTTTPPTVRTIRRPDDGLWDRGAYVYGLPAGRNEVVHTVNKPAGTNDIFQPGPDWCRDYGPCSEGQGDCDGDAECQSGLICAQDVGADYGWPASRDVCEKPAGTTGNSDLFQPGPDWCRDYGPCPEGQGDCDGDAECQSGLICAQDVGANYGWPADRDVCERPAGTQAITMSPPSVFRIIN